MTSVQFQTDIVDAPVLNKGYGGKYFSHEQDRLDTFDIWPDNSPVDKFSLAKAGFYYSGREDEVVCFSCGLHLKHWDFSDSPASKHHQASPCCTFVLCTSANFSLLSSQQTRSSDLSASKTQPKYYQNEPGNIESSGVSVCISSKEKHIEQLKLKNGIHVSKPNGGLQQIVVNDVSLQNGHQYDPYKNCVNHISQQNRFCHVSQQNDHPNVSDLNSSQSVSNCTLNLNASFSLKDMKVESKRLETFQNGWPLSFIKPEDLANAGFFYVGISDKVQCPFCQGIVSSWEEGDDPLKEHVRHFPCCSFVFEKGCQDKRISNSRSSYSSNGQDVCGNYKASMSEGLQDVVDPKLLNVKQKHLKLEKLGISVHRGPKHLSQASLSARLRSFAMWPEDAIVQPKVLAEAGFFYVGVQDHTKCFYCDGGLSSWELGDDPWVEHARWFSNCGFVRINKGDEFIRKCFVEQEAVQYPTYQVFGSPNDESSCENGIVQRLMQSGMITLTIQQGLFKEEEVRNAVSRQVYATGMGFSTLDDLCEAIFSQRRIQRGNCGTETKESSGGKETDFIAPSVLASPNVAVSGQDMKLISKEKKRVLHHSGCDVSLEEENEKLRDQRICKICMDQELGTVFLPCGHLLACPQCAPALKHCPLCRKEITGICGISQITRRADKLENC
ncbi:putative inhibitor of apoptosis isoform X2 [Limulus polyphemus]|uniref:Inhibitor of apoptosis isoform X2 n=1 Tax=Limulus polyphemus TaxID=6850 RepID=A0ABM1T1Y6_LIMPO|nr:putative inhibitor of apoptosis isoform X2 [Limulus polyphemus]